MKRTTITGLTRDALTASGVTRASVTLDTLRADARMSGLAQVIAHVSDPSRVIVVFPGGAVIGTSSTPMGWADAEEVAASRGEYRVRLDDVAK